MEKTTSTPPRRASLGVALLLLGSAACAVQVATLKDAREAYSADRLVRAERILEEVLRDDPGNTDARLLLGFVHYREGRHDEAEAVFTRVAAAAPEDPDAHYGLGLVYRSRGRLARAREHALRAVSLDPARDDLAALLASLPEPPAAEELPPYHRPSEPQIPFVAREGFLRTSDGAPLLVKGVNLGVALPGRFPSEFPGERAIYDEWVELIAAMGANAVRLYTIHPPVFYRSLREYNLAHPDRPLLLVHGVWAELPEDDDYRGTYEEDYLEETRRVIDLLHGQARIPPRRGHASGTYGADVSPWLLALVIGREWEPWSVKAFDAMDGPARSHAGRYLTAEDASPMEAWLARVMDRITAYHLERYNQQTPIAFTNWPTLDPVRHPTESSWREEVVFRRAQGEQLGESKAAPFDEDDAEVDSTRIRATEAFRAGTFAAYHAYPYYPDFLRLDPRYAAHPRSSYAAYLADLKAHHGDQPVLIAEFGVPSSRGRSHVGPDGRHHGGLTEEDQARIDVELWREIVDAGMAGGIVFSWLDEWFKSNWRWVDLERPHERNRTWHNLMDPEQHFGLMAAAAPDRLPLRGPQPFWDALPVLARSGDAVLKAHADAEYLHVLALGADSESWRIELDTHPSEGPEFQALLGRGEGRLRVNEGYRPFRDYESADPWAYYDFAPDASPRPGAPWADWVTQINRRRFGRDGTEFHRVLDEPGILREGRDPPGGRDPLVDYQLAGGGVHLRLPWTLIGMTDPGQRLVLDGRMPGSVRPVEDIGVRVVAGPLDLAGRFTWERWDLPDYSLRLKPAYLAFREVWSESGGGDRAPSARSELDDQ